MLVAKFAVAPIKHIATLFVIAPALSKEETPFPTIPNVAKETTFIPKEYAVSLIVGIFPRSK